MRELKDYELIINSALNSLDETVIKSDLMKSLILHELVDKNTPENKLGVKLIIKNGEEPLLTVVSEYDSVNKGMFPITIDKIFTNYEPLTPDALTTQLNLFTNHPIDSISSIVYSLTVQLIHDNFAVYAISFRDYAKAYGKEDMVDRVEGSIYPILYFLDPITLESTYISVAPRISDVKPKK